jgi:hypothetical protein
MDGYNYVLEVSVTKRLIETGMISLGLKAAIDSRSCRARSKNLNLDVDFCGSDSDY